MRIFFCALYIGQWLRGNAVFRPHTFCLCIIRSD